MKIKITTSHAYHEAMLTIAYLSNKGDSNLTPLEYRKLVSLCKAAERYDRGADSYDINIHEQQTTAYSFEYSLYYSLFEFVSAVIWNFKDKKLRIGRFIGKWVKFVQVAELSSRKAY